MISYRCNFGIIRAGRGSRGQVPTFPPLCVYTGKKMSIIQTLFSANEREIAKFRKVVEKINALEPSIKALTDEQLTGKTDEFRERLANGEGLNDLLPEAFAVVREAAVRTLGLRHFDVQMIGGMVLHQGRIAEMKTG